MYSISNDYKAACKALTRQSKTKIIINNKTYDGSQYIKDYPKFSHSNDTMIGGFPIKSAEFSLWVKNGPIDIIDKEIKIYRGLLINEEIEWIPQGAFFAEQEDITTSDTGEYITVKCYDNAKKLGTVIYKDNDNDYPQTESNYIKKVIAQAGYEIDENYFVESNYMMKQKPNMPEKTNSREIISRYAEQRGAIALFSRIGKVQIKKPTIIDFNYSFYQYKKLSCENVYGPLNQLIIGNKGIDNNVIFPSGKQSFPWTMFDNPFLDLLKETRREEVYSQIKGQKLIPFTLESALDSFYLDINDIISVQKKDGNYENLTILSIETENRLKCKIGASVQNKKDISYSLAGSIKEDIESVKFVVDYNKKQIDAAVTESKDASTKVSQLSLELGQFRTLVQEVAKLTESKEKTGTVELDNINESEPVELEIYPTTEDIICKRLRNNNYLSNTNYLVGRTVIFENTITKEKVEYELPSDLLFLGNKHDTYFLNYNQHICQVEKKIGINSAGEKYLLEKSEKKTYAYPSINLKDGNYKVYVLQAKTTAHIRCALMTQNIYTDQFWTKVEAESKITQTVGQISLDVTQKLKNYSTTSEMNSAIDIKVGSIESAVSEKYATKGQLSTMESKIKQTTDSIEMTISKKIGSSEVCSIINQSPEAISLKANRFSWQSTNSSLGTNGTLTAKNVDLTGKITATSGSFTGKVIAGSGEIGGFDIGTTSITSTYDNYRVYIGNASNANKDFLVVRTGTSGNYKYPFIVSGEGKLTASDTKINGDITATKGKIAEFTINGAMLVGKNVGMSGKADQGYAFWAGSNTPSSAPFRVGHNGALVATSVDISGKITATSGSFTGTITSSSGTIGGFNIGSDRLYYGNTAINRNGNVEFRNDNGYFSIGNNGVFLCGSGMQKKLTISDMLGVDGTGDVNASIGLRAFYGNIKIASNEWLNMSGALGTYLNNQHYAGTSSKNTKENIQELSQNQIQEVYDIFKNLKFYQYDYKESYGGIKNNYGFLIEDIENTILDKVMHIYRNKKDKNYKNYNSEDLTRLLLIVVQELMKKVESVGNYGK